MDQRERPAVGVMGPAADLFPSTRTGLLPVGPFGFVQFVKGLLDAGQVPVAGRLDRNDRLPPTSRCAKYDAHDEKTTGEVERRRQPSPQTGAGRGR